MNKQGPFHSTEQDIPDSLAARIRTFLEMIKFEHTIFALPFAYLGLFLAEGGWPEVRIFLWVTLAMVTFRTMAMGANRLIDAAIDGANPRTRMRAIPARKLKPSLVWPLTLLCLAGFEVCAYVLGPLCFRLSIVPVFLAWLYPWLKRFTWFSHGVLGIILGIAPYGAWIAGRESFSWTPGLLMAGVAAWVAGFDIIYALQDEEFDREYGLFSFPSCFGRRTSLIATLVLHIFAFSCWFGMGLMAGLGAIYWMGLLLAGLFMVHEHHLIHTWGLSKVQQAFFNMNATISVVLFLSTALDLVIFRGAQ